MLSASTAEKAHVKLLDHLLLTGESTKEMGTEKIRIGSPAEDTVVAVHCNLAFRLAVVLVDSPRGDEPPLRRRLGRRASGLNC
ncbi:hypothetical protein TYRP_022901 [Tyrophagus putrescentiae]|nr:hypothetical protein TYRP_022901 [Tyrophagus putrescentiae]